jgi:uncharacterized protein YndB with AHSA1/START domain
MMTSTPPVMRTISVACTPDHAFTAFTEQIGQWWPLQSHTVFEDAAVSVEFVDGTLLERSHDGRTDVWGEVLAWEPPHQLAFTWHPGRPDGPMTEVRVTFTAEGDHTRVDLEHSGWESFGDRAGDQRSGYDSADGWTMVLRSLLTSIAVS